MAFNQKKFLDSTGVSTLWSRINAQLANRDALITANQTAIAENKAAIEAEAKAARAAEQANATAAANALKAAQDEETRALAAEKVNADAITGLKTDMGSMADVSTEAKTVAGAIDELRNAIGAGGTAAAITLTASDSADFAKVYTLKQGENEVGVINIPKDMVVSAGEVVVNPEGQAAGTYIKLTLANSQAPLFINVADLVDVYTAKADAAEVQLTINAGNVISAVIVDGAVDTDKLADGAVVTAKIADANVTKAKLDAGVQASLDKADLSATEADLTLAKGRILALENKFADSGEGTVADQIADVKSEAATDAQNKANTAKSEAIEAAAQDATSKANAAQAAAIAAAATDAQSKADTAKSEAITAAATDAQAKADAAQAAAEATASADATSKANKALEDAKAYTDEAYGAIVALSTEEIDAAIAAATPNQG